MRGFGSVSVARGVERLHEGVDVVAVHALDVPAERLEACPSGSKPVTSGDGPSACWLLTSTMPIRLSSFQMARRPGAFPDRALAEFAVGEQAIDEGVRLLALQPEAEADGERQPVPERAAGDLHARRVGRHAGHGQPAVVGAVALEFVLGNDAGLDQRRVERDGVVADREQEAVAALPFRIVRAVAHRMEVGHREHVRDAERLGDVALALHLAHAQRIPADAVGPIRQGGSLAYGSALRLVRLLHSILLGTSPQLSGSACRRSRR